MTAVAQPEPAFKHCKVCNTDYTRAEWHGLAPEISPSAPDGITYIPAEFDNDGHMLQPARVAVWKQCPPPCRNTLVDLEER